MIELPDDELDKLFRKSSEEFDPQFDPEDWNSLKKRLDETDGRTPAAWFRKWWPLGLLLLLISGGIASYYLLDKAGENGGKKKIETVSGLTDTKLAITEEQGPKIESQGGDTPVKTEEKAKLETKAPVASDEPKESIDIAVKESKVSELRNSGPTPEKLNSEKKVLNRKVISRDNHLSESSSKSVFKAAAEKSRTSLPRSRSKAGGVYLEPNRSKVEGGDGALSLEVTSKVRKNDSSGTSASELGARQAIGSNGVTNVIEDERMLISAANLNNRALTLDNKIPYPAVIAPVSELPAQDGALKKDEESESEKNEDVESPKWAVRFGYSPDLSTVGLKNFSKPGTAVSLLVEYAVWPKLYMQSGVIWSRKDYFALASSYTLSDKWGYFTKPKSVDGECKVLEIPLNLRYDLFQGQNSRWFAGAGVSSYHMQNEVYKYNYENENDPQIKWREWKGKTGWYWLSHLNVSVGYEYRFSRKLSLLAEPYVRVPLKKVGYGKVNLITTGMWLSLRYTPAFR
jgi:hypothetical protein